MQKRRGKVIEGSEILESKTGRHTDLSASIKIVTEWQNEFEELLRKPDTVRHRLSQQVFSDRKPRSTK